MTQFNAATSVAVLIPDKGDRPTLLQNCLRMIGNQTRQPDKILVFRETSPYEGVDITWRYRNGYNRLKGYDVVLFMENDDYYRPEYIEEMLAEWDRQGRPDMLGTSSTIYYHVGIRRYFVMKHRERASMMNTLIKGGLEIKWPQDQEPFTDMWLWMKPELNKFSRVVFTPQKTLSIGIKHGIGLCGGSNHKTRMHRYVFEDGDLSLLKEIMQNDEDSLNFYAGLYEVLRQVPVA